MSRRKNRLILLILVCIAIILAYTICNYSFLTPKTQENQPQNPPPSEGPELEVPESPLGTIGLITAIAVAFGLFAVVKQKK